VRIQSRDAAQTTLDQSGSDGALLIDIDIAERPVDHLLVDTFGPQFLAQDPRGGASSAHPRIHPHLRERSVVDQAHLSKPIQHLINGRLGNPPVNEVDGKLVPRPRSR
jgi:hypothetical protein